MILLHRYIKNGGVLMDGKSKNKKYFLKGYMLGAAFCGAVALLLLIALWIFM